MNEIQVVVFDVNETVSDMAPLRRRFTDVGAQEGTAQLWFSHLLRDGFALTAAGGFEHFAALADGALRAVLADVDLTRGMDDAVTYILDGFADLQVHPDVPSGVRRLAGAGFRLVTLSNGSADVAERLFARAGIRDRFERLMSVDAPGIWKPAAGAYEYAARTCEVPIESMLLVAVHPWDIDGAARAGMRTAWVNRAGGPYPRHFAAPEHTVAALPDLATALRE